jgi:alpha-methylacyl-CoA racemase
MMGVYNFASMTNAHKLQPGPLAGLRIIEMAALGPVPFCGMMFADLGAEVIRIVRADTSSPGEPIAPHLDITGRGRRSIALDLKSSEGIEIVLKLVATADALMEGMRPGAMERLGLGPDECLARNSRLIYGRMTGWGQTGPLAQYAGHDINYISLNGVLDSVGSRNGPPVPPLNLVGDYGGGSMFLIVGILAALHEAGSSGKGQVIDAAMLDGSSYLMSTIHMFNAAGMWQPRRGSNFLDGGAPFYGVYETSDGQYMSVGAIEPQFYREFVAGLGLDLAGLPSPDKPRNWEALRTQFEESFGSRTREEWIAVFSDRDACVTPVLSVEESITHEHNRQRGGFIEGSGAVRPNTAPRFSRSGTHAAQEIAPAGEHGREILRDLEFEKQQIDELIQREIVVLPDQN